MQLESKIDLLHVSAGTYQRGFGDTHPSSGAKKRFKLTKNGKIKRGHAFRSHILTKKTTKLTRGYRQPNYVDKTNAATIKSMLPYA